MQCNNYIKHKKISDVALLMVAPKTKHFITFYINFLVTGSRQLWNIFAFLKILHITT